MSSPTTRARGAALLLLACFTPASSGCGSIFLGSTQVLTVHSNPASATVRILQTGFAAETPALVPIARDSHYVLVVEAAGYRPVSVPLYKSLHMGVLLADIFLTGLIGVIVDAITGHWYVHHPRMIYVNLEPLRGAASAPPRGAPRLVAKVERASRDALRVTIAEHAPGITARIVRVR